MVIAFAALAVGSACVGAGLAAPMGFAAAMSVGLLAGMSVPVIAVGFLLLPLELRTMGRRARRP